jgi:hypothetical protein
LDSECGRDIDFKMISVPENSNKFQKNQVLEGKNQLRRRMDTIDKVTSIDKFPPLGLGLD